jgi:very-short-patch-repair endonuclease
MPNRTGIIYGPHSPEKRERAHELRMAMTPAEALLWRRLRSSRLRGLHFRRQQVIDGFIVDFYCHEAGVVVEVDGAVHDNRREYDAERDTVLAQRELLVLRVTNDEVRRDVNEVVGRIVRACLPRRERGD